MKTNFDFSTEINRLIEIEGDYVDHPDDPGGATRWGVTERVARKNGYSGDMRQFPIESARKIYMYSYIIKPKIDHIQKLSSNVAWEVFDTGVNCGVSRASKMMQRALNALNKNRLFAELKIDGMPGGKTFAALKIVLDHRSYGESVLLKALNCLQGEYYMSLGQWSKSFTWGWLRHRVEI